MNFFSILACIGLLAIAATCGVLLGILEQKIMEDDRDGE